jgi:hypothetical protein
MPVTVNGYTIPVTTVKKIKAITEGRMTCRQSILDCVFIVHSLFV